MNFEEQFPSLKNKITKNDEDALPQNRQILSCEIGIDKQDLMENCLDKQKVRTELKKLKTLSLEEGEKLWKVLAL